MIGQTRFVGLANYVNLFTRDPIFWGVFRVTLFYTAEYLVLNIVISLGMAVWIGSLSWGRQLFRLVFFLPTFTPLVGIAAGLAADADAGRHRGWQHSPRSACRYPT